MNNLLPNIQQNLANGAYLDTDTLTEDTLAITSLADSLGRDPQSIFEYVYNTIDFVPSYGVLQGADYTLESKRGNAFDTSLLLASLLKTTGTATRFAYGSVELDINIAKNWLGHLKYADSVSNLMQQGGIPHQMYANGGGIEFVQFEHLWVQAFINGKWVDLDASIKTYDELEGVDLSLIHI